MPTTVSRDELDQFVELVQTFREKNNISIAALARKVDVRVATLSELLSGTYPHSPSFELIKKLAKACEIRIMFSGR